MTTPAENTQGTTAPGFPPAPKAPTPPASEYVGTEAREDWSLPLSLVDEVMGRFDFGRVHTVMTALNWQWGQQGVPSLETIRERARELLTEVATEEPWAPERCIGTGGFRATRCGSLSLTFEISSEWSCRRELPDAAISTDELLRAPADATAPIRSMMDVARLMWRFLCDALQGTPGEVSAIEEGTGRALVTDQEAMAYFHALVETLGRANGWPVLPPAQKAICEHLDGWIADLGLPHCEALRNEREKALLSWFREWDERAQTGEDYDSVRVLLLGNTEEVPLVFDQLCDLPRQGTFWRKAPRELFRDSATHQTGQTINLHAPRE